jgi:anti-sigma factor RsiW
MTETGEMTCRELVEIVTLYLEGEMPPAERERFEQHLAICDGCSAYVEQMRWTIEIAGALSEESIAEPVREKLLDVFRDWKRTRPLEPRSRTD